LVGLVGCGGRTALFDGLVVVPAGSDADAAITKSADAASKTADADALRVGDAAARSADGADSGASALAGLRIAFVGNENPNSELLLLTWLGESTGAPVARILIDPSELKAASLADYDLLILERLVRAYSTDEAGRLATWVSGGGAVFSVTGFYATTTDPANTNSMLQGLGLEYGSYLLGGDGSPAMTSNLAGHPIMAGITSLPFWGGFTVKPSAGADSLGTNATLAWADSQPAGVAQERGSGRALVWGDEWIENDSQFGTPDVRRFWEQALAWLTRR
jgi:hypothetical protein